MHHTEEWKAKNTRHKKQVTFNLLVIPIILAHIKPVFLWVTKGTPIVFQFELTSILMLLGMFAYQAVKLEDALSKLRFWHERVETGPPEESDIQLMIEHDRNFMERIVTLGNRRRPK